MTPEKKTFYRDIPIWYMMRDIYLGLRFNLIFSASYFFVPLFSLFC